MNMRKRKTGYNGYNDNDNCSVIHSVVYSQYWVMQSKVLGTDSFISLHIQNIPVYKATLPVLASVCTIHSSNAAVTRKHL